MRSDIATAACVIVLFLSACQKDETIQPASGSTERLSESPTTPLYQTIKIDHQAGYGIMPVSEVIVLSDHTGTFIGHRNVGTIGTKTFTVNDMTYNYLQNIFISA